jgi:hypothetical protein
MIKSRKSWRSAGLLAATAGLLVLTTPMGAQAVVTPQYVAGSSVARKPTYNPSTGFQSYNCAFSGWAHVKVNSQCRLEDLSGVVLQSHSHSFTTGSYSSSTFMIAKSTQTLCVVATAAYSDGSDGDTDRQCL